jgi:hypothetical protein
MKRRWLLLIILLGPIVLLVVGTAVEFARRTVADARRPVTAPQPSR